MAAQAPNKRNVVVDYAALDFKPSIDIRKYIIPFFYLDMLQVVVIQSGTPVYVPNFKRHNHNNTQSRGFKTSWNLVITRLAFWW